MKNILYISGTRADFGLMRHTLEGLHAHPEINMSLCVTGMHLSEKFGNTVDEIRASSLPIAVEIPVPMESGSRIEMATGFGVEVTGMAQYLEQNSPDAILLLGDRGEMLAAAIAAAHLNIPILHIGGGERSGTIDESIRHAISKFAHYHFTTTDECRERLVKMGEVPETIYRISAPGLDEISVFKPLEKEQLFSEYGFNTDEPVAICAFHPVVQKAEEAGKQMSSVLSALEDNITQALILAPNADAGNQYIRHEIERVCAKNTSFKTVTHLPRNIYLSWLKHGDILIGNSSSGIIESASFGIPTVNIGSRQAGRERNKNTYDVKPEQVAISQTLEKALDHGRFKDENIYGNGDCHLKLPKLISNIQLDRTNFEKMNSY